MTNAMLTQALETSVKFELTELKMRRMLAYQKIAKKAYKRWMDTVEKYQQYDKAAYNYEFWTIIKTKKQVHDEAMNHYAAYIHCLNKVREIKSML